MTDTWADGYMRWFDMFEDEYRDVMTELSQKFGTLFCMTNTGGGCMAINAVLEGYELLITDAEDTLSSPHEDRLGYAVGVYKEDTCGDAVGWASSPEAKTTKQLIRLIQLAIASVPTFTGINYGFRHVDPKELA